MKIIHLMDAVHPNDALFGKSPLRNLPRLTSVILAASTVLLSYEHMLPVYKLILFDVAVVCQRMQLIKRLYKLFDKFCPDLRSLRPSRDLPVYQMLMHSHLVMMASVLQPRQTKTYIQGGDLEEMSH